MRTMKRLSIAVAIPFFVAITASVGETKIQNLSHAAQSGSVQEAEGETNLRENQCRVFFPMEVGNIREVTNYNAKGKVTGSVRQEVKQVSKTPQGVRVSVFNTMYDKKGEVISSGEIAMQCQDNEFHADAKLLLDPNTMGPFKNMDVQVESVDIIYPSKMYVGQLLPEAQVSVRAAMSGVSLPPISIRAMDRKVLAIESVTTPAGTFECYKIGYEIQVKALLSQKMRGTEWIAEGVGMVKSESYDKRGKLVGQTVLTLMK